MEGSGAVRSGTQQAQQAQQQGLVLGAGYGLDGGLGQALQRAAHECILPLLQGMQQGLLAGEMGVEPALGPPGRLGDVLHTKFGQGRVQNLLGADSGRQTPAAGCGG